MRKTTDSIYLRIYLPFAVAIVAALFLAWWTATTLLTETLDARVRDQLTHATTVVARGTFPFTADLLDRVADLQNAEFALLRPDGRVGLSSLGAEDTALVSLIESAYWSDDTRDDPNYDIVFAPLEEGRNESWAAVAGVVSLHDVRAAARRAAIWVGVLALVASLALAAIGHWVTRRIAEPLGRLNSMAQRIAAGDRDVRADTSSITEVSDLALALNDMTERLSSYEDEIVERNRLVGLGEIAARVAHEIRNPLTAMKMNAQLLQERLANQADIEIVERLLNEMERLDLVVGGVVALGRPIEVDLRPADLNDIVDDVVVLIQPQFEHKRVDLTVQTAESARGLLDANRLKQALFNLLTNAADALPAGGNVCVATSVGNGTVRLTVEDSGPGFTLPPTFQPSSTSEKVLGLGVGLVITAEIVELHGGSIEADTSPGLGGARITIELPAMR